jgi:hypothetical protein
MDDWISVKKRRPKDGDIIWAYFGIGDWIRTEMAMYTPNFIAHLCRKDEGQWKGMGSEDEDNWTHWVPIEKPKQPRPPK